MIQFTTRWGMYTYDKDKDETAKIVKMIMDDMNINSDQAYLCYTTCLVITLLIMRGQRRICMLMRILKFIEQNEKERLKNE